MEVTSKMAEMDVNDVVDTARINHPESIGEHDPEEKSWCRLCAVDAVMNSDNMGKWKRISDNWLGTSQTIEQFVRENFSHCLLAELSDDSRLQHICGNCLADLQQIKIIIENIVVGQGQLRKLFKSQMDENRENVKSVDPNNSETDGIQRRKRGRPRKDPNQQKIGNGTSMNNTEPLGKRTLRRPKKYESESSLVDDVKNNSSVTKDILKADAKGGVSENCPVNESSNQASFQHLVETKNVIDHESCTENGAIKNNSQDARARLVVIDVEKEGEEKNYTDHNDDHGVSTDNQESRDASFSMKSFYQRMKSTRRRKRGRPKKRKGHEFKCDLCEKVYSAYASLVYHRLSHSENTKGLQCTLCQKTFLHKALLANHMYTHSSIKPYLCDYEECNASFKSRGSLYNHKKAVHESKEGKMFTCETCGLQFTFRSALQAHQKIHTGEKPYNCQYCSKSFRHHGNLKEHVRTHTKEKPYVCSVPECGKCFTTSSQLRSHKMRHSEKHPYLCAECGKTFTHQTELFAHTRCHKDNSNTFTDRSNSRKHKKTHRKLKYSVNKANAETGGAVQNSSTSPISSVMKTKILDDVSANGFNSSPVIDNSTNEFQTTHQNILNNVPVAESFVQILTEEELSALGASVNTTSNDGNIIFLYPTNDLYPVSDQENVTIQQVAENTGGVLSEVVPTLEVSLPLEFQEEASSTDAPTNN